MSYFVANSRTNQTAHNCAFKGITALTFAVSNRFYMAGIHRDFYCDCTINRPAGYHARIFAVFNHIALVVIVLMMMFVVMLAVRQGAVSQQQAAGQGAD